jgi:hypothetical protein
MIGRIRTQLLLNLMMVHPEAVAVVMDGGRLRTNLDDVREENGYG